MSSKTLIVAQYGKANIIENELNNIRDKLVAEINKAIEELKLKLSKFEDFLADILEQVHEIGDVIQEKFEKYIEQLLQTLNDCIDAANKQNTPECQELVNTLQSDFNQVIQNISLCIQDKAEYGAEQLNYVTDIVNDVFENLTIFKEEAYNCTQEVTNISEYMIALICLNNVGRKVIFTTVEKVPIVVYKIAQITAHVTTFPLSVGLCAGTNIYYSVQESYNATLTQLEQCLKSNEMQLPSFENNQL